MKTSFVVIMVTCGSKRESRDIVNSLLKKRSVACANIISGVSSKFWWRGKINSAREFLIVLKADRKNFRNIERTIKRIHSYVLPEIIALPIVNAGKDYLRWLGSCCG